MPKASSIAISEELVSLVAEFLSSPAVTSVGYKEDWTRAEYIEPLFNALGWTRLNPAHLSNRSTGYVRELPLSSSGSAKSPDYGFYVDGLRTFYVEAKKPSVNIRSDSKPALQIRNYGWSAKDDIGILTDFQDFAVYNCRLQPDKADTPDVGRVDYLTCSEFESRWQWLVDTFSPQAVSSGSLAELADNYKTKKRLVPVDSAFLQEIEDWRKHLAQAVLRENSLSQRVLSSIVQTTIDRIVFLRIAEARGLESEGTLQATLQHTPIYPALLRLFDQADTRYNSGLFHFRSEHARDEPDALSKKITIDDSVLRQMIDRLTSDDSPYRFSVLPTDILGQIYERFLGREIQIHHGQAVIEDKPEYRKSGGVYYTPSYVVDYIVDHTLGPLLAGKSTEKAKSVRIVDPACGSGSFLISAYQYLLDWYLHKYSQYKRPADRNRFLMTGADGRVRLKLDERKRILLDNIYGVDIDAQAVEVSKLSLLLKVIEGETQTAFVIDRLLPDLDANIVCGNSLVGSDFYTTNELITLTPNQASNVNALDWSSSFPSIAANSGFDAVIGNPPWLMAGYYVADSVEYFHRNYEACSGKVDLYYLFLEKALRLVKPTGRIGMIVPSKLFHTQAGRSIRGMLTRGGWIEEIVDFGTDRVFSEATNYSCILTLSSLDSGPISVIRAEKNFRTSSRFVMDRSDLGELTWHLIDPDRRDLWSKLSSAGTELNLLASHFGNGVQSGSDKILILNKEEWKALGIEAEICRPILKGRNVRRFLAAAEEFLLFPYETVDGEFRLIKRDQLRRRYPNAFEYLMEHRKVLTQRRWFNKSAAELSGDWYGMMYLDSQEAFAGRHIVTPALSNESNFAIDSNHLFVTGTAGVSSVILNNSAKEFKYFVLGVLNSTLLSEYIIDHSTPYQGNYFKFSAPYIRGAPIRLPDVKLRSIVRLAADIASVAEALSSKARSNTGADNVKLNLRLDDLVCSLYEVTDTERACLAR